MDAPHRAARIAARQRRLTRPGIAFAPLPRPVDAQHEKGQPPRADALKRREPVGDLLVTRAKEPLEQQPDRKSVRRGKSVSEGVDLGGRRTIKKTKNKNKHKN